jgi:hypothetical protein
VLDDSYDLNYLEAHLNEDSEEIDRIEEYAKVLGFGPLVECTTTSNFSEQKVFCREYISITLSEPITNSNPAFDHRNEDGHLLQLEMQHLACNAKVRVIEPQEAYRDICPFVLIIIKGHHPHPVPLPQKTPPKLRAEVFKLLDHVSEDLADLTPRGFLRHPVLKAHLRDRFPNMVSPTLSDVHVSLANRSRLKKYIDKAKETHFPAGTGWEGLYCPYF